jgi:hypothetical protein
MDRDRDRPCVDQHNTQGNYRKITSNCRRQKMGRKYFGKTPKCQTKTKTRYIKLH